MCGISMEENYSTLWKDSGNHRLPQEFHNFLISVEYIDFFPVPGAYRFEQTDTAANKQISIQNDSRPSEFSRPLTSITCN